VAVLLLAVSLSPAACRNGGAAGDHTATVANDGPAVLLHAGSRTIPIRVELALTEKDRERGLMFRNHLDPDAGMLFVFPREEPLTFWMKNTLIPLDMLFIGTDHRVVGIVENATPETETPRRVAGKSQYVLELAGGVSGRLGITAGSLVELRGMPPDVR